MVAKKIVLMDLTGVLISERPFNIGHEDWFKAMAALLGEESIAQYAYEENWFAHVQRIMGRYVKGVSEKTKNRLARNLYAMTTLSQIEDGDIDVGLRDHFLKLKERYLFVLVTSFPTSFIADVLERMGCPDLFDSVYSSDESDSPHKEKFLSEFADTHGKPFVYISSKEKNINAAKQLGFDTVGAAWFDDITDCADRTFAESSQLVVFLGRGEEQ